MSDIARLYAFLDTIPKAATSNIFRGLSICQYYFGVRFYTFGIVYSKTLLF